MTPVAVSRAACCCRTWRLLSTHEKIWEKACYDAWEYREEPEVTERIARDRFHGSWRRMFFDRVRLRTEGLYVSRNTYIKPGVTDWDNVRPVHLVCYYRYFRFFSSGEFICKTSPHNVSTVYKTFKSRYLAAKDENMYHGGYRLACEADVQGLGEGSQRQAGSTTKRDETRLHLECIPRTRKDFTYTTLHMWLRLRSTHPGASNRLDFVKLASVDNEEVVPHPSSEQWAEVDDPALAYRRSCGINVKRYNGTAPVRELSRGLNTLVFVPWEDVHDHVLNLSTDKMDFFVTG